ncbi:hypothetical protein GGX14DRAFT_700554 [Mycena pura]|uniref:C2H2-type domain-containing protein n=1 Tax=Mycena pura TaxID=153505 RepID=A0AAD6V0D1_9AGAR|nr:hypothetical protein GGX14DRAFT_700554 [Mycena pura]
MSGGVARAARNGQHEYRAAGAGGESLDNEPEFRAIWLSLSVSPESSQRAPEYNQQFQQNQLEAPSAWTPHECELLHPHPFGSDLAPSLPTGAQLFLSSPVVAPSSRSTAPPELSLPLRPSFSFSLAEDHLRWPFYPDDIDDEGLDNLASAILLDHTERHSNPQPSPDVEGIPSHAERLKGQRQKAPPKLHKCEVCSMEFLRPSGLRTHMNIHNSKRRACLNISVVSLASRIAAYKCEFPGCFKSFSVLSNARRHYRTHNKGRPLRSPSSPSEYQVNFDVPITAPSAPMPPLLAPFHVRWVEPNILPPPEATQRAAPIDVGPEGDDDSRSMPHDTCPSPHEIYDAWPLNFASSPMGNSLAADI